MIDYDINDLTVRIYAWFDEKGLHDSVMQFAKLNEEVGEMAHELTRGRKDSEKMKDAIGDVFVTLVGMAHHLDMDISECINMAYKEIRGRTGKVIEGSFVKESKTVQYREYSGDFEDKFMEMLGFCVCGNPSVVISQVYDYLKNREHPIITSDEELLLAHVCDMAGLTEHGSSVYGAWVSPKGKELLKEMEANEL